MYFIHLFLFYGKIIKGDYMTIRINNLSLGLDDDIKLLKKKASKKLRISVDEIKDFKIVRESIDARNKDDIFYNYTIDVKYTGKGGKEIKKVTKESYQIEMDITS